MDFNPIKIAAWLDKIASEVEKSPHLTNAEKHYFAYRIDKATDQFEKVAAANGFNTKNGTWLMGDADERSYMKKYDEPGRLMGDTDEPYMEDYENTVLREAPSVSTHKEPPIRDLTKGNPKSTANWDNPWRDENLPEGNKVARTIPKRKFKD